MKENDSSRARGCLPTRGREGARDACGRRAVAPHFPTLWALSGSFPHPLGSLEDAVSLTQKSALAYRGQSVGIDGPLGVPVLPQVMWRIWAMRTCSITPWAPRYS